MNGGASGGANGAWIEVWRGPVVESRHRVSVAVVDASGAVRAQAGDPRRVVFARSAVKPIQALPLVADGGVDRFGLTGQEMAVCCASHNAEPLHLDAVRSLLGKIGAGADALECGPHPPLYEPAARALRRAGRDAGPLHNNCSGKHAGMLALARLHGWSLSGYRRHEHPVQRRMLREVAEWTGIEPGEIALGVDGCGVSSFGVPLTALAGAFARLAAARRDGDRSAPARVIDTMISHPAYVAGTDRLCSELMRVASGRIFAKVGAEGVYCAGIPGAELGVAIKIDDGARRAVDPALLGVLRGLGLLSDEEMSTLGRYAAPDVTNTRGERVGRIRSTVELAPGDG